jgi:hypothetical protein
LLTVLFNQPGVTDAGLLDAGAGAESLDLAGLIALAESALGQDSVALTATLAGADAGTGSESLSTAAAIATTDNAVGGRSVGVTSAIDIVDAAMAIDELIRADPVPVQEQRAFRYWEPPQAKNNRRAMGRGHDAARGDSTVRLTGLIGATDDARASVSFRIVKIDPDLELVALALAA